MCGIAGIISTEGKASEPLLAGMLQAIKHRGPEDTGSWFSSGHEAALGQQRLAIIDLSPGGHQPMVSLDARYAITFNGEIYNYRELRAELVKLGHTFTTESDTEVLLTSYIVWGSGCVHKLNGMFAFAVWDEKEKTLFAARDRMGEKPFKYYHTPHTFAFASELKSILTLPGVPREVDWQSVDVALTYRYVPSPRTGFKHIQKLPAGHTLLWKNGSITIAPYWQPATFAKENHTRSLGEWKTEAWNIFADSVKKRMISDVPIGAFLSGGLDSSSVVAAMAEVSTLPVRTFSVGFKNHPESETPFAKLVADRYHTNHTEIIIDPEVITTLPSLISQYEEPFFDNSAIPTMAMAKETKKHVTVVLTGDGGDECFGGYPNHSFYHYFSVYKNAPTALSERVIPAVTGALASLTGSRSFAKADYRAELLSHPLLQAYVDYYGIWQKTLPRTKFYITKNDLYTSKLRSSIDESYTETLMSEWLALGSVKNYGNMNRAMLGDIASRLSDDYLVKVDMASMLYALESRPPFLDHRLVELSLSMPEKYKVAHGQVKWIWKQIIQDKLPETILTRRKMGFGIPIIAWMRGELYPYLREQLLTTSPLYDYIDRKTVERLIEDHKAAKADYSNHIWSVLLLKQWLETFFYGR